MGHAHRLNKFYKNHRPTAFHRPSYMILSGYDWTVLPGEKGVAQFLSNIWMGETIYRRNWCGGPGKPPRKPARF